MTKKKHDDELEEHSVAEVDVSPAADALKAEQAAGKEAVAHAERRERAAETGKAQKDGK